jgi:hypothetical protein
VTTSAYPTFYVIAVTVTGIIIGFYRGINSLVTIAYALLQARSIAIILIRHRMERGAQEGPPLLEDKSTFYGAQSVSSIDRLVPEPNTASPL